MLQICKMDESYWKCRICLSDDISIPIFGSKIKGCQEPALKLKMCLGKEVPDLVGYPRNICMDCYKKVNGAFFLINKFYETSALLESKLQSIVPKEIKPKREKQTEFENENFETPNERDNVRAQHKITYTGTQGLKEFLQPLEPNIRITIKPEQENCDTQQHNAKVQHRIYFTGPQDLKQLLQPLINNKKPSTPVTVKQNKVAITDLKIISEVTNKPLNKEEEPLKITEGKENVDPIAELNIEHEVNNNLLKSLPSTEHLNCLKKKPRTKRKRNYKIQCLCELCGKLFQSKDRLRSHVLAHTTEEPLECPVCTKKYAIPKFLHEHFERVHGEKKLVCSVCGKMFSTKKGLNVHYRCVHLKIKKRKTKYPCRFCGKLYSTASCALIHERSVHTGERPAICNVCGASFFHELYLKEHERLHTGETPYKCPVCGRAYAQRGNMKSHIKHNHRISQLDGITLSTIDKKYFKYMKP